MKYFLTFSKNLSIFLLIWILSKCFEQYHTYCILYWYDFTWIDSRSFQLLFAYCKQHTDCSSKMARGTCLTKVKNIKILAYDENNSNITSFAWKITNLETLLPIFWRIQKCMSLRNDQEYYPKSLLAGHRGLVEYTSKGLTCSSSLWYMTSSQRIRLTCILVQNEVFHIDWWYIKGIKEIWLGPRKKVFSDKFNLDDPHKWLNIQHYIKHLEKSLM